MVTQKGCSVEYRVAWCQTRGSPCTVTATVSLAAFLGGPVLLMREDVGSGVNTAPSCTDQEGREPGQLVPRT